MLSQETEGYGSIRRWGRILFAERDVLESQPDEWLDFASRCRWDGLILSASAGIAYYPSKVPLHPHAPGVDRRDVFGEWVQAARKKGLKVVGQIDPSAAPLESYLSRPDWFFLGADGEPRRSSVKAGSHYACINASLYWEQIPLILSELMENYRLDGIVGANWRGYGAPGFMLDSRAEDRGEGEPCQCSACREKYRLQRGSDLPTRPDRSDPAYRRWMEWRIGCCEEIRSHWSDTLKLLRRNLFFVGTDALESMPATDEPMGDSALAPDTSLREAGARGRMLSALSGGSRPLQIVDASSDRSSPTRSPEETERLLALAIASGSAPCISFGSAMPLDRRPEVAIESFFRRHAEIESRLDDPSAKSLATVAVVVSERTRRFHPESDGAPFSESAKGFFLAMSSSGIPYDLLLDSQISYDRLKRYRTVVLPNVACLSQDQCDILWEFGSDGGGIVATYETSVYDETGAVREDFGMTDRLGAKLMRPAPIDLRDRDALLAVVEPHEALEGFEGTSALPWGGRYLAVELLMDHKTPLVAAKASSLPLKSRAGYQAPAMLLGPSGKGRVVYFPAEIDRACWRDGHPDHVRLLLNAIRWAHKNPYPLQAEGSGEKEVFARETGDGILVHLVNLSGASSKSIQSVVPLVHQRLRLRTDRPYERAEFLITGGSAALENSGSEILLPLPEIETHEIVAIR